MGGLSRPVDLAAGQAESLLLIVTLPSLGRPCYARPSMRPTPGPSAPTTYLYIDEAGNLDFGEQGTRFVVDKRELTRDMSRAETLYPAAFARLMDTAMTVEKIRETAARVIVVTDTLPVRRERSLVTKTVKLALHERARDAFEYRILHHASRSDMNLQVADYVCWCVYRRAARADVRSFARIETCVRCIDGLA